MSDETETTETPETTEPVEAPDAPEPVPGRRLDPALARILQRIVDLRASR